MDKKISEETNGTPAVGTDELRIRRGSNNFKLALNAILALFKADADVSHAIGYAHSHINATALANVSGTNTGDEDATSIKSKLGITTLSGSNTGDQDLSALISSMHTRQHAVTSASDHAAASSGDYGKFLRANLTTGTLEWAMITGGSTNFSKLLIVDPNGNDSTGTKGDISKPYLTIEAAVAAASSGDTIEVMPGAYTPATNLAKDGVIYSFHQGAVVTKSTIGAIFDYVASGGYTSDINILGSGSFSKISATGAIFTCVNANISNIVLNFDRMVSTKDKCINVSTAAGKTCVIMGNLVSSSANNAIYGDNSVDIHIEVDAIISTAAAALAFYYIGYSFVSARLISSTSGYGMDCGYNVFKYNIINVGYCTGSTFGYITHVYDQMPICITGNTNSISNEGTHTSLNGRCAALTNTGSFNGGIINSLTCTAGSVNSKFLSNDYNSYITVSGGLATLDISEVNTWIPKIAVSGTGKLITNGDISFTSQYGDDSIFKVTAGTWISNGNIKVGGSTNFQTYFEIINLSGTGIAIINGLVENLSSTRPTAPVIRKTGGTLILNGAILRKNNTYHQFIHCPTAAQDVKIYSKGVSTNGTSGELLSAKARKDSLTVTAVATTTIVLNDGSGAAETFTETDTTTYNTTTLMAARMVDLINASATLDITSAVVATNNFTIEADVPGVNYTQSGLVNLVNTPFRLNSFAITNLTPGAVLIEDTDVTF
jgi:hypothetical protein